MKLNFKILIMGVAGIALMLGSCSKQAETAPAQGALSVAKTSLASVLDECVILNDSVSQNVTSAGAPYSVYSKWVPGVTKTLSGGPQVEFEGIYSSFIRPATAGWYVGTVPLEYFSCDSTWASIANRIVADGTVKNASGNYGTDPSHNPYNVVGYHGSLAGYVFNLGYYDYSPATPEKVVVIWKDTDGVTDQDVSNPTANTVTEAWLINVTSLGGSGGISNVHYEYLRKL